MKKSKVTLKKYGWGSTIGGVLGGTAGLLLGGPPGAALGASLGSAGGGMIDSSIEQKNYNKELDAQNLQMKQQMDAEARRNQLNVPSNYGNSNQMYPYGGQLGQPNAEVELNEVAKLPNGDAMLFDGPSHEEGGIPVNLPQGTEITSDRLINHETGKTYAQEQKSVEMNKNKQTKRLDLRPNDAFLKSGVERSEAKSKEIFKKQEEVKEALELADAFKQYMKGGIVKYTEGGTFGKYSLPATNSFDFMNQSNNKISFNPLGQNGSMNYTAPDDLTFEQIGEPVGGEESSEQTGFTNPGARAVGLGLSGIGLATQFGQSFFPDKIERMKNPYKEQVIGDMTGAVNNQRGLDYDVQDQLTDIASSEQGLNRYIDSNIGSGSGRVANRMANRGQSIRSRNSVYGDRNRANTGIQTQANQMQQQLAGIKGQLGSEQTGYDAMYQDQKLKQKANQRFIRNSSLSNAGSMLQQYGVDDELMSLLPSLFPNSGVASKYKKG